MIDSRHSNYDVAFVLLALSLVRSQRGAEADAEIVAYEICDYLAARWKHLDWGYNETTPPSAPLLANPHMHLFEAFLSWIDVSSDTRWTALADEIGEKCVTRLINPFTGAIQERFDLNWKPLPDGIVEPGHQFEWAWLLATWAHKRRRIEVLPFVHHLITIGEVHGVDGLRGVAVNELNENLAVRDGLARLWPQLERAKAWYLWSNVSKDALSRENALDRTASALRGARAYLSRQPRGLWWETMDTRGNFDPAPARASSLYHIVCAVNAFEDEQLSVIH